VAETIRLTVNGSRCEVAVGENAPLLDVLRNRLGLPAAHFGCGAGQCGACHVIVDGHAVASCETPMWAVAGKSVTTLEGLGTPEAPHPLQAAIVRNQAMQCGYCMSGIILTAAAFLTHTPNPDETQVRAALDRNLCRCGSHNRVVRAVMEAANEMAPHG
jgi:nicotinate dehydrogenase subunit A